MGILSGKSILITGGSRGIGAGIARWAAQNGARIALTYTSRPDAAEEVLQSLPGDGHFSLEMNVASAESVEQAVAACLEKFNGIDGLVNNAGITKDQLLLRMKEEDFSTVIDTNLKGVFLCTKAVMKTMLKQRRGSIVNVTSVIGYSGNPGQSNYAASKSGVVGFTKSIAQEVAARGVRINCVAPGFIVTDMTGQLNEEQKNSISERIPLGRLGQVEDVAEAAGFLLGDGSSYITGQTIHVNGGLYM